MKNNYICEGMEECLVLEPDADCIHKRDHDFIDNSIFIGCNDGYCAIIDKKVNCTNVRKLKLNRIKKN